MTTTIHKGQTASLNAAYVRQTGSLAGLIIPPDAVAAGAKWRRVGTEPWLNHEAVEQNVPTGDWTVQFSDLSSWFNPGNQQVTVQKDQVSTVTGVYSREAGALTVTINPTAAVTAGAMWRCGNSSDWRSSGATAGGIPVGDYTIEFSNLPGWNRPANQSATITTNHITVTSGTYTPQTGTLGATITPPEAIAAGAGWRRLGTADSWRAPAELISGIPVGGATVEFKAAPGWKTPANQVVTVYSDQTAYAGGVYTRETGALAVTLSPAEAVAAGGQWKRNGTATWLASAASESNVPIGAQQIDFKAVTGWKPPASQDWTIVKDQQTIASGVYQRQTGTVAIAVTPGNATWSFTDGDHKQLGGTGDQSFSGIPTGQITVTWKPLTGYDTPSSATKTLEADQSIDFAEIYLTNSDALRRLDARILRHLLGITSDATGLNVNGDGVVDVADLTQNVSMRQPASPASPNPANSATGIAVTSNLDWTDCAQATSYDVYLWKTSDGNRPASPTKNGLTSSLYGPPASLGAATNYQWQIVAKNKYGETAGPVWTFKTH